jgi:hypothetical protein
MNIQEAYKKLDLARGLGRDRVDSQYRLLKDELMSKISTTQNEKLINVYKNRLEEVESAYLALVSHFENANQIAEPPQAEIIPPRPVSTPQITSIEPKTNSKKKSKYFIIGGIALFILILIPVLYFKTNLFRNDKAYLFRVMEGEKRVLIDNITLRQFPDAKSSKIEVFPFGTRLLLDESEPSKTDNKNVLWKKVRVIHPIYGWEKPDDRFPYPYEGWMAIEQCGVKWVEDSTVTNKLARILVGNNSGRNVISNYRLPLVNYFEKNNYLNEWELFGKEKIVDNGKSKSDPYQYAFSTILGNSNYYCIDEEVPDFIAQFKSKTSLMVKLLIMTIDINGQYKVLYDQNFSDNTGNSLGLKKMSSQDLYYHNYYYYNQQYLKNAVWVDPNIYGFNTIGISNGVAVGHNL